MSENLDHFTRALSSFGAETHAARRVRRVAPWIVSAGFHGLAIMLALAITYSVANLPERADEDAPIVVADFNALNYAPVVGSDDPQTKATGPLVRDLAPAAPIGDDVSALLRSTDATPSIDVAAALGHSGDAAASAALGRFAPAAGQVSASFAGVTGSNARKIVYCIDASGSMISSFQIVLDELGRSLANLSPRQSFAVIFFQEDKAIETPPAGKLVAAGVEERTKAQKWIAANVVPAGGTNPLVAIEKALDLKPDVIFLLSQDITGYGQFELDQKDLLERLDQRNPRDPKTGRRPVQINCIQFLDPDPLGTMDTIAREHGGPGGYKFLSRKDLGLDSR